MAGEEGQAVLSGVESHTAWQGEVTSLQAKPVLSDFFNIIPYSPSSSNFQTFSENELKRFSIALPLCSRHLVHKIVSNAVRLVDIRSTYDPGFILASATYIPAKLTDSEISCTHEVAKKIWSCDCDLYIFPSNTVLNLTTKFV